MSKTRLEGLIMSEKEIPYEKRKCLICKKVHVKSYYISFQNAWFFLCELCHKDLKEILK